MPTNLEIAWFLIIGFIFVVFAILDGFDLGIGFWHLFTKGEEERNLMFKAIGPLWDGNEVWLIAGGAGLFAAFPLVYATFFSGLYLAVMVLIWALIFRAISFEFRNELTSHKWRRFWDFAFAFGSVLTAFLLSVALGNVLHGFPMDEEQNFNGAFLDLLNPYALIIGVLGVAMFCTHGAAYLSLRTEKEIQIRTKNWLFYGWIVYIILFIIVSGYTIVGQEHLMDNYEDKPYLWVVPILTLTSIFLIREFSSRDLNLLAFIASALSITMIMVLVGIALYPNMIPATDPNLTISIADAAASSKTLEIMLIIGLVGFPIIILYTAWVYKTLVFEKVQANSTSY